MSSSLAFIKVCYDFFFFFQKLWSGTGLLTKGPLALFYGGNQIINYISQDTVSSTNIPFYLLLILSPLLQLLLVAFKHYRFRKGASYDQLLREAVMSGVRNVYGQIIVFMGFLTFCLIFVVHSFLSKKHQDLRTEGDKDKKSENYGSWMLMVGITLLHLIPYRNPKLR